MEQVKIVLKIFAYFHKTFRMDIRIARIFNTYGPGCKNLFIYDLMSKII